MAATDLSFRRGDDRRSQLRARFVGHEVTKDEPLKVLLLSAAPEAARALARWADERDYVEPFVADSAEMAVALADEQQPEVFIVDLLLRGSEGVALGIDLLKLAPHAELVFLVESLDMPEVRAAMDVGLTRFLEAQDLPQSLVSAVDALARLARARRSLDEARRVVEDLPWWRPETVTTGLPLSVAERRYREAYLRASLAKAGARRAAARLAGVPYTTFCVMLRKLGIAPRDEEELP